MSSNAISQSSEKHIRKRGWCRKVDVKVEAVPGIETQFDEAWDRWFSKPFLEELMKQEQDSARDTYNRQ